jgi:hypothetical protein
MTTRHGSHMTRAASNQCGVNAATGWRDPVAASPLARTDDLLSYGLAQRDRKTGEHEALKQNINFLRRHLRGAIHPPDNG